jgi:FkbM family methyltransferase
MWITNAEANEWYSFEHQDPHVEKDALRTLIKPGDRVLEIGSHHGFTALLIANYVGKDGFVLGVEANPMNALIDQAQLALNGVKNLKFIHAAGADRAGRLRITSDHNAHVRLNGDEDAGSEVAAVTGDMLDSEYGPFNVLKIDVEGYEVEVLRGCKNILARAPKLEIELHIETLQERGYSVKTVLDLIDANRYEGQMRICPDAANDLVAFDPANIPPPYHSRPYTAANIFLTPKIG